MSVQIQLRRDTAANWSGNDPTLAQGELGVETDTNRFKLGDGVTPWTALSYGVLDGQISGYRFVFQAVTADADPGAGNIRFDNASFALITNLYIDNTDGSGGDITTWLDSLDDSSNASDKGALRIEKASDVSVYREFAVSGTVIDGTGYRKVPVTPVAQSGALSDADDIVVTFYRTGNGGTITTTGSKADLVNADKLVFKDSEDFNALKEVTKENLLKETVRNDEAQVLSTAQQAQAQTNMGAFGNGILSKSAAYTVVAADNGKVILVDAAGGAVTITLPAAATAGAGFKSTVKKTNAISSTLTVTIDGDVSETIDGAATYVLYLQNQSVTLVSDGSNWQVVNETGLTLAGTNSNGKYELHANGSLRCWSESAQALVFTNGNIIQKTWTYPYAFVAGPAVAWNCDDNSFSLSAVLVTEVIGPSLGAAPATGQAVLRFRKLSSSAYVSGDTVNGYPTANGRWR